MLQHEGFPGQRMLVLPGPLVDQLRERPITERLLVTDVGYFPRAQHHGRQRPQGSRELIVIVCTDGAGECEVAGDRFCVTAGQAVVVPPGQPHSYRSRDHDPWTIWWCHLVGPDLSGVLRLVGDRGPIRLRDPFRAVATLSRIVQQIQRDETYPSMITAAGDAWSLLTQITVDHLSADHDQIEPIRAAQDHLRERLAEPLSVPALARIAGLSTSHFAALFRRTTGGGVLAYLKSLRMARARELLDTTDLPVQAIALQVGYPDPFYFARQFRGVHQLSPTQYRARG